MRNRLLASFLLLAGCGGPASQNPDGGGVNLGATDPAALRMTVEQLAMLGEKKVGSGAGQSAASWVRARMEAIGLKDVHTESFNVPRHDVVSSSLAITVDGKALAPQPGHDVFDASGAGDVTGALVDVADASPTSMAGKDLKGKIALVFRNAVYHRSTQYRNVVAAGAVGMLYISAVEGNLRQVGTVRRDWEAIGAAPAITIGADDGAALRKQLEGGHAVTAAMKVDARVTDASGTNVIGRLPGSDAGTTILVGGHFDTWFSGATDNLGGVAAMLGLAERRAKQGTPRYTIVFIAWDGEETGLYGGYDYLRKHRIAGKENVLAVLNFEVPSAKSSKLRGLARSNQTLLVDALDQADLSQFYNLIVGLEEVPKLFGGIIPTDIQGLYRNGVAASSTAADTPYYHTTQDTPDKVDYDVLAGAVDAFDLALGRLLTAEPAAFGPRDNHLWTAPAKLGARVPGMPLTVEVTARDGQNQIPAAQPGPPVITPFAQIALLYNDFYLADMQTLPLDQNGKATFQIPDAALKMGKGPRYLHVSAGLSYALVEEIVPIAD